MRGPVLGGLSRAQGCIPGVALLLASCSVFTGEVPLDETAEVMTAGGDEQLRHRPRPIRGEARALIIALDGVGDGALRSALADGALPTIDELLGDGASGDERAHGYLAPNVVTTLPSTTMAAWATLFTGEPPGVHGIIGNEWFDRTTRSFYAPAPVSVPEADHTLAIYTEDLVGQQLRADTLFERLALRSHVSLGQVHRGADLLTFPNGLDLGQILSILPEAIFGPNSLAGEAYIELDEESVGPMLDAIEREGVPDVQVAYFPGVDLIAHASDPPLEVQRRHLEEVIEPAVARVVGAYRDAGVLESTFVFVIADHGHTPVLSDDEHALGVDDEGDPPAALAAVGFRMRPAELETDDVSFSAVVAYQGGLANVYLADRSTCPAPGDECDWSAPPRYEHDVLVAGRALFASNRGEAPAARLRGALELVLVREPRGRFRVLTADGPVPVSEHLRRHPRPEWVAFERRLRELTEGPMAHRAGDVIIISRLAPSVPYDERTYFSGPYHSWHGSPTRQDSIVPLVVAHPQKSGAWLRRVVETELGRTRSTTAFVPLVERLLRR